MKKKEPWIDDDRNLYVAGFQEIYPVKVYSSGGSTNIHDYLMSDGSILTMHVKDARKMQRRSHANT